MMLPLRLIDFLRNFIVLYHLIILIFYLQCEHFERADESVLSERNGDNFNSVSNNYDTTFSLECTILNNKLSGKDSLSK